MSYAIYMVGAVIVMAGVLYAEHLAHIPQKWMVATALLVIGAAVLSGASRTRQKDPNS